MIKEALKKNRSFKIYLKNLPTALGTKHLSQLISRFTKIIDFKQTLRKNKKEVFSGLLLFIIFFITCIALYPHNDSKANNKIIATSKLPQKGPSTVLTPTPKITNSHNKQYNKNNLIIYYPHSISPTVTPSANSSTSGSQKAPENNTPPTNIPTPFPKSNQVPNSPTAIPIPTITHQQNSNQTPRKDSAQPQITPIPPDNNTEGPVVGTLIQTGKTLTSNLLEPNH